ncbi:MAG TPA: hypothetical protein VEU50_40565 [Archangium sp.]|nr:hypothetical protein [Archangium sp.]HYO59083.1 hypothetical protein [Archangium sp.]
MSTCRSGTVSRWNCCTSASRAEASVLAAEPSMEMSAERVRASDSEASCAAAAASTAGEAGRSCSRTCSASVSAMARRTLASCSWPSQSTSTGSRVVDSMRRYARAARAHTSGSESFV